MSTPPKTSARGPAAPGVAKTAKSNAIKATQAVKATRAVKARVSKTASATQAARARTTSPAAADGVSGEVSSPGSWSGRGPGRGRGIYDRQRQRGNERWPIAGRLLSWLFRRPELLLTLLDKQAPIRTDGRVMNRGVQAVLEVMTRLEGVIGSQEELGLGDPEARRKQMRRFARITMPIRTDVHVVGRLIPGAGGSKPAGEIPVRIYRRFGTGVGAGVGLGVRPPAIVYYHGGGWVVGDLVSHDSACRLLAAISRCVVIAVDYRLAPEDPFPAAVDDAVAAYGWVHGHVEELGIAEGRVGVMGDSAGGNLAAVVALLTRPGAPAPASVMAVPPGVPAPVAQGLIYPGLSTRFDSESMRLFGEGFFLTEQSMVAYRGAYLPNREDWELGTVSPLLADDVEGVAPALVVTAGFDPLRDDGDGYARKLKEAGVEVEYRCYDDQVHGFFNMGFLDDSLALSVEVCDAMGRLMYRDAPGRARG
ncbi:MAG TPA: alpha/beta hydrolase [Acidimicrobiales bacterium]|nr:alpha/beta hydrolase [Acidimicrobiales bacterium]